ncbi:hypothetical protein I118_0632 [Bifidobacterium longum D2957]|nr:hypothetical protein I118_0632 [Bifidobacterium longum D2957]
MTKYLVTLLDISINWHRDNSITHYAMLNMAFAISFYPKLDVVLPLH